MKSDLSQFKLGARWSIGNSILKTFVSVFVTYLILKKLSVEDYGVFNLIIVIVGYIQLVVIPGLLQIIRRFVPEFVQTKDFYGIHYFTKSYCIKVVAISIFFQVLLYLFSNEIGAFFSILDFWNKIKFLFFFIPFYFVGLIFNQLFNSLLFQKFLAIINFSTEIVRGAIILIMFSIDVALEWVLLAQGITWCLSAVLFIVVYYSKFLKRHKSYFEIKTYDKKRFNDFGIYTYFNEIGAKVLNVSTDYFIIGAYLGPLAIGYYAFANKVVTIIGNLLPNRMMKGAITAFFYKIYAKNKTFESLQSRFDLLMKFNLICVAPVVFSILGFGEFFIQYFFQSKYDEAMLILYVLSVFMITKTITHPIGLVLTALEDVKIILYSKLISFVNILFAIILVKYYGAVGVAIATCLSVFFKDLIILGYARYKYKLALPTLDLIKIFVVSSFIFVIGFLVVSNTSSILFVAFSWLLVFMFVGYLIVSRVLSSSELILLKNMVRKK